MGVLMFVLILAGLVLFSIGLLDLVAVMGHNIPQEAIATDYVIGVIWALFLGVLLMLVPLRAAHRRMLIWGWAARCLVTLGFMLLYENNYGLDAYYYWEFTSDPNAPFPGLAIGQGNLTVHSLAWLHHQVFPSSYHMMKVSFSMVGMAAIFIFYHAGVCIFKREDPRIFYVIALWPSIIFWSSTLGKDPVILLGIATYAYGVARWHQGGSLRQLLTIGLGVAMTMSVRVWLGMILVAPLAVFALRQLRGFFTQLIFISVVAVFFIISFGRFKDKFNVETRQDLLTQAEVLSRGWAFGGSAQIREVDISDPVEFLSFLPLGIFSALFRPLPGESANPFMILAGLENALLLLLLGKGLLKTRFLEFNDPVLLWSMALVLCWSSIYGPVSFQNLGTAARFKLQVMPIMLGAIFYLNRRRVMPAARLPALETVHG